MFVSGEERVIKLETPIFGLGLQGEEGLKRLRSERNGVLFVAGGRSRTTNPREHEKNQERFHLLGLF